MRTRMVSIVLVVALLSTSMIPLGAALAQEQVIVSLAVPDFQARLFDEDLLGPFEAQTGVKVNVVGAGFPSFPFAAAGVEAHLDAVEAYVNKADVVYIDQSSLSPEATRAGYFLNIAPLAQSDPALYSEDFFPAAWQSFQWDQGLWALPVSLDLTTLNYNPEAFDRAGIPYPNEYWTMDDLASAARDLTERDEHGEVTIPGVQTSNPDLTLLLRALLGHGLYDDSTIPETPYLTDPALEPLLTTWLELEDEGVSTGPSGEVVVSLSNTNPVPMRIEQSSDLATTDEESFGSMGALLPGGVVGLRVQGFAVSGGTKYPEAAYELVKYLSSSSQAADNLFSLLPARQSLVGQGGERGFFGFNIRFTPEIEAFLNDAVWRALPASELRYSDYLALAVTKMRTGLDARTALQEVELEAVENLRTAEARRDNAVIAVATPMPTPDLAAGRIAIKFGYQSLTSPLPNQDLWDQAIEEFTQYDPEVGQVIFDTSMSFTANRMAEDFDCFFLPYNEVPNLDPEAVYNLDPFLDADPTFDRSDVVGDVLGQVQRDNKTWALPVVIQPSILRYNPDRFARAGLTPPEDGWTIDAFVDALRALKIYPEDPPPFVPRVLSGGTYMLMFIAAFGGVPIDYRTTPPTVAFTDPANVDAIRQALDLARDDYIDYSSLGGLGSGEAIMLQFGDSQQVSDDDAIYPDSLDIFGFNLGDLSGFGIGGGAGEGDRRTTYPRGNQYLPASYTISTAYISANAENPQACYRWLSFFAQRPELFTGMPVHRSMLDDPALVTAQGEAQVAFYREYDAYLLAPNTIVFPTYGPSIGGVGNFFIQQWLFRAFDNYVIKDMDLETELAEAELFANAYQECEAQIPPYDPLVNESVGEYLSQFLDCATLIDPTFEDLFGNMD
ncbi:MAG: extracellular solute-binding protein [Anaerolineae bacterium]|nr:extracellular solute-binding protein [Anaerolineae bacterium]